jgi:hypothetical protein
MVSKPRPLLISVPFDRWWAIKKVDAWQDHRARRWAHSVNLRATIVTRWCRSVPTPTSAGVSGPAH